MFRFQSFDGIKALSWKDIRPDLQFNYRKKIDRTKGKLQVYRQRRPQNKGAPKADLRPKLNDIS